MEFTKAVVLSSYDDPPEVRELQIPSPEPGAMIVEVSAATMCGTDVHICDGGLPWAASLPLVLGHEMVGKIVESNGCDRDLLGRPISIGDLVAWSYAFCGECYWCTVADQPTCCERQQRYGWGPLDLFPHLTGGFAQHAYVLPRCEVVKVPDELEPALAAAATCSLRTAVHALERVSGIFPGETVVVQGTGPVGLWTTALVAAAGAGRIVAIGAPRDRLDLAQRWGASDILSIEDTDESERKEAVLAVTEGRGADVLFECSGSTAAVTEGLELARRGARYAVVGQASDAPIPVRATAFLRDMVTMVGVRSGHGRHYYRGLEFLAKHQDSLPFGELLGRRYSLTQVPEALMALRSLEEIKPVILP